MMMMVIQCPSISLLIRASKILQFTGKPWEGGGVVERSDAINAAVGKVNHSSLIHSKIICSAKYWFIWVKLFYMSDGSLICVYIYIYIWIYMNYSHVICFPFHGGLLALHDSSMFIWLCHVRLSLPRQVASESRGIFIVAKHAASWVLSKREMVGPLTGHCK